MMSQRPHGPVADIDVELLEEISALVVAVVPRPDGVPEHWRGSHGDLTPWNLRRARGARWLIDWEDAGYAPPWTDHVYFQATTAALRRDAAALRLTLPASYREAVDFVVAGLRPREHDDPADRELRRLLEQLLERSRP